MPQLKVMTWNVENLFDPAVNDRLSAAEMIECQATYTTKLDLLSQVIKRQTPDLIGFHECSIG